MSNSLTTCAFCERTSNDPAEDAWEPYYWDCKLNREVYGPVCTGPGGCVESKLHYNPEYGDYELPSTTHNSAAELPSDG